MGMVSDEQIKKYCDHMGYKLERIDEISFVYEKPDGTRAALLKAAACYLPKCHP